MRIGDTGREYYYPASLVEESTVREMLDESHPSEFRKIEAVLLAPPGAFVVSLNVDVDYGRRRWTKEPERVQKNSTH